MKRFLTGVLAVVALILGLAAPAAAAPEAVVVRIVAGQAELNADGTVSVTLRVRYSPPLYAFELNVGVTQGPTVGALTLVGVPLPVCTGRWERITQAVAPETGAFGPGPATVSVYVGVYDPGADRDLDGVDSAAVRL